MLGVFLHGVCGFAAERPNIVVILADDLGWRDVGCYGSKFYETPHIDKLATQGMRFTDGYAACAVCSPTRASIMTGKYPARLHITDFIGAARNNPKNKLKLPDWQKFLPLEEVTIAEALKSVGYATASIGKWHLGGKPYYPEHQGFDLNIAGTHAGQPASYFWPYEGKSHSVAGLKAGGHDGEYLTDRLTSEAEKFIEQNKDKPFFLYLTHYAVHTPLMAKPKLVAKYESKLATDDQKNAVYAAMIESVDDSVGRLMAKLDALGIAGNTIIVFTGDNGGLWPSSTSNAPLRAGKGYAYEGGTREPLIIKWPGATKAGTTCNVPVCSIDFFPTFLEAAGVSPLPRRLGERTKVRGIAGDTAQQPSPQPSPLNGKGEGDGGGVDGVSLVPLLKQTGTIEREALYWHYPHYWDDRVRPCGAMRAGDWKLIEFYEDMRVELYNLKDDLGEQHDLAGKNPGQANELREKFHAWRKAVGAQMPTPQ